ncbi:DUF3618 domain-containing protein [Streptomyces hypolithicus]
MTQNETPSGAAHGEGNDPANGTEGARLRVEQARERLGETVEQLAAKADVKSRTQAKAAEVKDRVQENATRTSQQVQARTPEPVLQAASQVAGAARRHLGPLVAVGAVTVALLVVARRRGRRR